MKRSAKARWDGSIKGGAGKLTTDSGVLSDTQYSFSTRFENGTGSNPEELIAAAHAGCFSMALSGFLESAGQAPTWIETKATVTLQKEELGFSITGVHLDVTAEVPGMDAETFQGAATEAKEKCPVSRVLDTDITMDARLAE
ncbi:MAG: OsmC family protein [Longimicrobiales bacterium]|nr:OsmC family protein [Longimicrobiales bacterium]